MPVNNGQLLICSNKLGNRKQLVASANWYSTAQDVHGKLMIENRRRATVSKCFHPRFKLNLREQEPAPTRAPSSE